MTVTQSFRDRSVGRYLESTRVRSFHPFSGMTAKSHPDLLFVVFCTKFP
jgi:hypothetical protein